MKGILLAAGSGTRLSPATFPVSKILLPIYDRPMVYYPLSTLIMAGVDHVLVITNEFDLDNFKRTLGDGSQFGIKIEYAIQYVQRGIADAFIIAEDWIAGEKVVLILGDNIFYGDNLESLYSKAASMDSGAVIFGIPVPDPERFGVIGFDDKGNVTSLEEKPEHPKSNYASVGLYFYDGKVCSIAKEIKPSKRGELEITDVNSRYLENDDLSALFFDDETEWIDAGTFDSLLESSNLIARKEKKLGRKILCPELVAYKKGFITKEKLSEWIAKNKKNEYYEMIMKEIVS